MSYTAPTAADLKARFPAFSTVDDGVVTSALADAARKVDETWAEGDFAMARMLYAAHVMTLDGLGTSREAKLLGFKRIKVGTLELERGADGSVGGGLSSTTYGMRFAELARLNFGGGVTAGA
jgi:hypothetical protein